MIEKFEDLEVWKESIKLSVQIYKATENSTDYGLRDQIRRSAVSVPSNIAEGYEQKSNKEFIQFLYVAKASCGELRTQIYLCEHLDLISRKACQHYLERTKKISAMLYKLIQVRINQFS